MIQFHDISLEYEGNLLISNLNSTINTGEKVVIAGASGSGKSSLLAMIPGFVYPNSGRITVDGLEVTDKSTSIIRSMITWIPQEFYLPYKNFEELITVLFSLKINKRQHISECRMVQELEKLNLPANYVTKSFSELSGGERQRLLIATAGLLNKQIILLDEPTSALDRVSVRSVINYLKEIPMTMLAVSHDAEFISGFDRIIQL